MSNASRSSHLFVLTSSLLLLGLALPACGKSGNFDKSGSKSKQRQLEVKIGGAAAPSSVTANIAEFDPNADISLDMDKYGGEHPDEYGIQQAFFGQFGAIDECVWAEKDRRGTDKQLQGDVTIAVKLNPEQSRPFGVNASMPKAFEKANKLTSCLREAAAAAPYPTYDGPPRVVEFEFELDPGYVEE